MVQTLHVIDNFNSELTCTSIKIWIMLLEDYDGKKEFNGIIIT
ncbi:MAG TPA: hypothetical protein VN704_12110 [Verrucomicrobiae bacterium]|nr:hypothetical protein [Verrucomicrobiae bacterium]